MSEIILPLLKYVVAAIVLAMALGLLVGQWRLFVALPGIAFVSLVAFLGLALAIGHGLGGPDPEEMSVLATACATRHVGIVGAMLGVWLISPLIGAGTVNQGDFSLGGLCVSLVGAVILLAIVNLLRRGALHQPLKKLPSAKSHSRLRCAR